MFLFLFLLILICLFKKKNGHTHPVDGLAETTFASTVGVFCLKKLCIILTCFAFFARSASAAASASAFACAFAASSAAYVFFFLKKTMKVFVSLKIESMQKKKQLSNHNGNHPIDSNNRDHRIKSTHNLKQQQNLHTRNQSISKNSPSPPLDEFVQPLEQLLPPLSRDEPLLAHELWLRAIYI